MVRTCLPVAVAFWDGVLVALASNAYGWTMLAQQTCATLLQP